VLAGVALGLGGAAAAVKVLGSLSGNGTGDWGLGTFHPSPESPVPIP